MRRFHFSDTLLLLAALLVLGFIGFFIWSRATNHVNLEVTFHGRHTGNIAVTDVFGRELWRGDIQNPAQDAGLSATFPLQRPYTDFVLIASPATLDAVKKISVNTGIKSYSLNQEKELRQTLCRLKPDAMLYSPTTVLPPGIGINGLLTGTALLIGAILVIFYLCYLSSYSPAVWGGGVIAGTTGLFWLILCTPWRFEKALWVCAALLLTTAAASGFRLLYRANGKRFLPAAWGTLLLTVAGIFSLIVFRYALYSGGFGDETEKFMLGFFASNGLGVYREVFSHHGPLLPMICHGFYMLFPVNEVPFARIGGVLLWLLPLLAIAKTRWLHDNMARCRAAAVYLLLASQLYWLVDLGLMLYQPVGGLLTGMAAILLLPLYADRGAVGKAALFAAGAALAASVAAAISFAGTAAMLSLFAAVGLFCRPGIRLRDGLFPLLCFIGGGVAATALVAVYLLVFGSLSGYWEEHIVFNMQFYAKYTDPFNMRQLLRHVTTLPGQPLRSVAFFAWLLFLVSAGALLADRDGNGRATIDKVRKIGLLLLLGVTFLFCAPRELTALHGCGALMFAAVLFSVTVAGVRAPMRLVCAVAVVGLLLLANRDHFRLKPPEFELPPPESDNFARRLVKPGERAIFYHWGFDFNFRNALLPGARHVFFLPWQADYLKAKGVDLADEIARNRPVLIRQDKAFAFGPYPWLQYAASVNDYVEKNYLPLGNCWFILPETAAANQELLAEYGYYPGSRTSQLFQDKPRAPLGILERRNPVRARLLKPTEATPPKAIKIKAATYQRLPSDLAGCLSITVRDEQNAVIGTRVIPMQRIYDNSWLAIPLNGKSHPAELEISCSAPADAGITLWTINAPEYANMTGGPKTPNGFLVEHVLIY